MAKRQTIGNNPLDAYISPSASDIVAVCEAEPNHQSQQQIKSSKQRITVQIAGDVIERLKNAVYWTPGLTLASLAEEAFSRAVDTLENERKTPFPKRKEELKTGRPIN